MNNPHYLATTEAAMQAAAAALWAQFLVFKRRTDPDALTPEGTVMYRSPFTGAIEPDAPRSTGWATPFKVLGGYALSQPQLPDLQLKDLAAYGVTVVDDPIRWPEASDYVQDWRPDGVYRRGELVQHLGKIWLHISELQGEPDEVFDAVAITGDWIVMGAVPGL